MSSDASTGRAAESYAIRVRDVSKHYVMFERPEDRFKQMVVPRLQRLVGQPPKRYFRDFAALNGVSLEIGRGETVGIIGRNGSGKSTLLQIICGTLQPTSGSVEVNGRIAALLELGAGFNPEFTGRENVFLNAQILGVPRQEMEWRFDDIARFADIGPFIEQPVKTYSSGMYVRLAFATAINVDPDILVVDEALAVGDEAFQRKCFARIEDIKDKGGTILFVSHGAQTIVQLCSRAMLIDAGEKILEGVPKTVVSQYQRLVNASPETARVIRAQTISLRDAPPARCAVQPAGAELAGVAVDTAIAVEDQSSLQSFEEAPASPATAGRVSDFYDPSLVSRSTVEFEKRGARIRDVRITMLNGERVNVLQAGKRYIFEYFVDFLDDVTGIGVGMWFRTVSGMGLAGAQSHGIRGLEYPRIASGATLHVRYEFDCGFLPGTYFCNCGVWGTGPEGAILMHRIMDVIVCRVAAEAELLATGTFNLNPLLLIAPEDKKAAVTE